MPGFMQLQTCGFTGKNSPHWKLDKGRASPLFCARFRQGCDGRQLAGTTRPNRI